MMNKNYLIIFLSVACSLLCISCKKDKTDNIEQPVVSNRIVAISDVHFFDTENLLVAPSSPFDSAASTNDVMILHSTEILDEQFRKIQALNPSILLIAGDLTNNGERINHEIFHDRYLTPLISEGVSVFVVPGNHDINSPYALKFNGNSTEPVANISPEDFSDIYSDCGFSNALSRDASTLSYSAILNDDLALIALDVCHYEDGISSLEWMGGSVSCETMRWIENQVNTLQNSGREVFVMMHHSATEIFNNENLFIPKFVIDHHVPFCNKLVELGIHFVFNGHFHSQDITEYKQTKLFDISIGSVASCACPITILDVDDNNIMNVSTSTLSGWNVTFEGKDFDEYANGCVINYVKYYIENYLPISDTAITNSLIQIAGDAYITHFHGDEYLTSEDLEYIQGFMEQAPLLSPIINCLIVNGLYSDIPPQDNTIKFDYKTGEIVQ